MSGAISNNLRGDILRSPICQGIWGTSPGYGFGSAPMPGQGTAIRVMWSNSLDAPPGIDRVAPDAEILDLAPSGQAHIVPGSNSRVFAIQFVHFRISLNGGRPKWECDISNDPDVAVAWCPAGRDD
jgi:hypothetical protein